MKLSFIADFGNAATSTVCAAFWDVVRGDNEDEIFEDEPIFKPKCEWCENGWIKLE